MGWCPFEFIGKTFGEERVVPEYGDPPDFQGGAIVDGGVCYMGFLKKLFIPCYLRSENFGRGGVCSPQGLSDPAQRCRRKKRRKAKKRHPCFPTQTSAERLPSSRKKCTPKIEEKPPEKETPPEPVSDTPKQQETEKPKSQPVLCPNCNKATTIIICDSCNRCHRIECASK